jgi:CheY-like chemotaxis protein
MDKAKILIVEDEGVVALDLKNRMEEMGHSIVGIVASGAEAIREAGSTRPHLVLMDIRIRGSIDGIEAARTIWGRFAIPVIYLTAVGNQRTLQRALEVSEVFGYAGKPLDDTELQTAVETALRRHRVQRNGPQDESQNGGRSSNKATG